VAQRQWIAEREYVLAVRDQDISGPEMELSPPAFLPQEP